MEISVRLPVCPFALGFDFNNDVLPSFFERY
jgi:hypothetical protein